MNILIVDDSKIARTMLLNNIIYFFKERNLTEFNIYQSDDGLDAIDKMKNKDINIIFLDWNMPNMDGEEVVDVIRSNKEWNNTRIVMATTEGTKDKVLKIMKKGVNGYLRKPITQRSSFKILQTLTGRM